MPYGIPEERGGESEQNVAKMERCVRSVTSREGVSEDRAIAMCKASLGFTLDAVGRTRSGRKRRTY